jgi:hypothetical protein
MASTVICIDLAQLAKWMQGKLVSHQVVAESLVPHSKQRQNPD